MGDVRDILAGATRGTNAETTAAGRAAFAEKMALQKKQKKKRPKGMSREVFALLGDGAATSLAPVMPTSSPCRW